MNHDVKEGLSGVSSNFTYLENYSQAYHRALMLLFYWTDVFLKSSSVMFPKNLIAASHNELQNYCDIH